MQDPARPMTTEQKARMSRERAVAVQAKRDGKCISYIDDDGCEVTVTPGGHTFYNASDWY